MSLATHSLHSLTKSGSGDPNGALLKVLITDDSPMYRRLLSEVFSRFKDVEVVGTSYDGEDCLLMTEKLKPNVITLDINMPRRDGLSTLEELRKRNVNAYIVMVSAQTTQSAEQTMIALRRGALDMILKPSGDNLSSNRRSLEDQLTRQVETIRSLLMPSNRRAGSAGAFYRTVQETSDKSSLLRTTHDKTRGSGSDFPSSVISGARQLTPIQPPERIKAPIEKTVTGASVRNQPLPRHVEETAREARSNGPAPERVVFSPRNVVSGSFEVVCIGVSTGGPSALGVLLPKLPSGLNIPIFIVQHMPPLFTKSLADYLTLHCKFPVCEAEDGQIAEAGKAYIAPGGKQMRVGRQGGAVRIEITDDPFMASSKPSVDYLLNSISDVYGSRALGLILTGMGSDGLNGCRKLFAQGSHVLAQSEETCVVYGMPRQVVEHRVANEIVPLPAMADRVVELLRGGR